MLEPVRYVLGEHRVWKGRGAKRRCISKEDCVMYVPILETLRVKLLFQRFDDS